ncbi:MAG: tetratricopeptide repeat protein, partial [Cyclobacteriaceae bacterium]
VYIGSVSSQEMTPGFQQLENGQFEEAKTFFEDILDNYPHNKTAMLCYGRATGLSGHPEQALEIFGQLNSGEGDKTEVLLNLAEAHLWNKDPSKAIPIYEKLVAADSTLFGACLGLANSYSMNKNYEKAYATIGKALQLDHDNKQALVSKKYIILAYASFQANDQRDYEEAQRLINENLSNDSADQESLMLKGNILLASAKYSAALSVFKQLTDQFSAIRQQSVALHLKGNEKQALLFSDSLLSLGQSDPQKDFLAHQHYLNALLWNNKLIKADSFRKDLEEKFPENAATYLSSALVAMYRADFDKGLDKYADALALDTASQAGQLGRADAYHALGLERKAYQGALRTAGLHPNNKEVSAFLAKVNKAHVPLVDAKYSYAYTSDGSYNRATVLSSLLSLTPEFSAGLSVGRKRFFMDGTTNFLENKFWQTHLSYRINRIVSLSAKTKLTQVSDSEKGGIANTNLLLNMELNTRANRLLNIKTGYKSELLDFNQALISKNIKAHHGYYQGNFFVPETGTGNYTEFVETWMSDGNRRTLLFTSVYQQIGKKKHVKAGANYLFLRFSESQPLNYFSPLRHQQVEAFVNLNYRWPKKSGVEFYGEVAYGFQWNEQPMQETVRMKVNLKKGFKNHSAELYGQYSTAANTSFNGFSFTEVGGKISLTLAEKPVFFKRMLKSSLSLSK